MKNLIFVLALIGASSAGAANMGVAAAKFVPDSKVVHETAKEVKLQTAGGSLIEVEFKSNGEFKEASGANVEKDQFLAPEGMKSLQDVLASVKKEGKAPVGKWSLEKGTLTGWMYEFNGFENGKQMEYMVDAKTAEIKKTKHDK